MHELCCLTGVHFVRQELQSVTAALTVCKLIFKVTSCKAFQTYCMSRAVKHYNSTHCMYANIQCLQTARHCSHSMSRAVKHCSSTHCMYANIRYSQAARHCSHCMSRAVKHYSRTHCIYMYANIQCSQATRHCSHCTVCPEL